MKLQQDLRCWGGLNLNAVTDEDMGDISLAIKYVDHGDNFLYIRTYSGDEYQYGYWLDRMDFGGDFDPEKNNGQSDRWFIKRPILYRIPDKNSYYSNQACFIANRLEIKGKTYKPNKLAAGHLLDYAIDDLKALLMEADKKNIYYSMKGHSCINTFRQYAIINELEQEYFDKINEVSIDTSIRGYDGLAGKREAHHMIYCDEIEQVIYRGRSFDTEKLKISWDNTDDWGCDTIRFNTKSLV